MYKTCQKQVLILFCFGILQVGRLVNNLALALGGADEAVQQRFLTNNAYPVSTAFGDALRDALAAMKANNLSKN